MGSFFMDSTLLRIVNVPATDCEQMCRLHTSTLLRLNIEHC